ncbi:MAG: SUMF1/EgtB/PvdO family nonheme iron enzyme [Bacteroidetes bacterium]|nr:SUMF1/EgtB/PvdO family nonheme iron enzyme [Bacteroidota bacterium]
MRIIFRSFFCISIFYLICSALFSKCSRDIYKGDIGSVSLSPSSWIAPIPAGMVVVPTTRLVSRGDANYEDPFGEIKRTKVVSVSSFLMDSAPITNAQYRLFISKLYEEGEIFPDEEEEEENENENESENESENTVLNEGEKGEKEEEEEEENPITHEYIESVKPNPRVWEKDFAHHMDTTFAKNYHSHIAFNNYPVVGITWVAAKEFCKWRTRFMNNYRAANDMPPVPEFRLPRSIEFEAAARGGIPNGKYPWGGPGARDTKGNILANFKSQSGDYTEAGMNYTTPVKYFRPNGYGLYDMNGNVWNWCEDARYPTDVVDTWDLNSVYVNDDEPMKVIMGGSFNGILHYCGYREYRHKDKAWADVGFRCVMDFFEGSNFEVSR